VWLNSYTFTEVFFLSDTGLSAKSNQWTSLVSQPDSFSSFLTKTSGWFIKHGDLSISQMSPPNFLLFIFILLLNNALFSCIQNAMKRSSQAIIRKSYLGRKTTVQTRSLSDYELSFLQLDTICCQDQRELNTRFYKPLAEVPDVKGETFMFMFCRACRRLPNSAVYYSDSSLNPPLLYPSRCKSQWNPIHIVLYSTRTLSLFWESNSTVEVTHVRCIH
jgi:hypothetical protein